MGKATKRTKQHLKKEKKSKGRGKPQKDKKKKFKVKNEKKLNVRKDEEIIEIEKKKLLEEEEKVKNDKDLTSEKNVGGLDLSSFFEKITNDVISHDNDSVDEFESKDDSNGEEEKKKIKDEKNLKGRKSNVKASVDNNTNVEKDEDNSDNSDEEEDIEKAEKRMKEELQLMKENDPDFHEFLREEDEELLEFGEEEEEDLEDETKKEDMEVPKLPKNQVTMEMVDKFEKKAFESFQIKGLKQMLRFYKSACKLSSDNATQSETAYTIDSSEVFDRLLMTCLENFHKSLRRHLLNEQDNEKDDDKPIPPNDLINSKHWLVFNIFLESFFKLTLILMSQAKEPKLLAFILKKLSPYIGFLSPYNVLASKYLNAFTKFWSAPFESESGDYHVVRLQSYLRIRQLTLTQPYPFIEECLKACYLSYAKIAKFSNESSLPTLTLLGNCLVDLYSIDVVCSYQCAFVYIRQLALLLRSARRNTSSEKASRAVLNWQYVNCMKLWAAVLSANVGEDDSSNLQDLVYPLTEIILGTIGLISSQNVQYLPYKFHCIRFLQQLSSSMDVYIPVMTLLMDILNLSQWTKNTLAPKKAPTKGTNELRLPLLLKIPNFSKQKHQLIKEYQTVILNELFALIHIELDLYRYSPAFPEFATPLLKSSRKFKNACRDSRYKAYAKGTIEMTEQYATFIIQARSSPDMKPPKDLIALEALKPSNIPNRQLRYKATIEKEKRLLEATNVVALKTKDDAISNKKKHIQKDNTKKENSIVPKKNVKKAEKEKPIIHENDLEEDDEVMEISDWSDSD